MTVYGFSVTTEEAYAAIDTEKGDKLIALLKMKNAVGIHPHPSGYFHIALFPTREQRDAALMMARRAGFETAEIVEECGEIDDAYRRD